jgi:uncharacterized protein (DUF2236 family)
VFPDAAGPFAAESPYRANNISALLWVYATLIDSARVAHNLILDPFGAAERSQLYAESQLFAAMFGIPQNFLPCSEAGLTAYVDAMCDSRVLTVSGTAREIASQILGWRNVWFHIPAAYRSLTAGMLPERLRKDFGLRCDEADRRSGDRAIRLIRRGYPRLPARLRYVGPYHEAQHRWSGGPNFDLLTRLSNRLWIGASSLGADGRDDAPSDGG